MGIHRNRQCPSVVQMFLVMIIVYSLFICPLRKNCGYLPVFSYLLGVLFFFLYVRCNPCDLGKSLRHLAFFFITF